MIDQSLELAFATRSAATMRCLFCDFSISAKETKKSNKRKNEIKRNIKQFWSAIKLVSIHNSKSIRVCGRTAPENVIAKHSNCSFLSTSKRPIMRVEMSKTSSDICYLFPYTIGNWCWFHSAQTHLRVSSLWPIELSFLSESTYK